MIMDETLFKILFFSAVASFVVFFILYFIKRTLNFEKKLMMQVARSEGLDFYEKDRFNLKGKTKAFYDFGITPEPFENILHKEYAGTPFYIFNAIDYYKNHKPDRIGWQPSAWTVCVIELNAPLTFDFIIYPEKVFAGIAKTFKQFSEKFRHLNVSADLFSPYRIYVKNRIDNEIVEKVVKQYLNCAGNFKQKISIQCHDGILAVYSDQETLTAEKDILKLLKHAKEIYSEI